MSKRRWHEDLERYIFYMRTLQAIQGVLIMRHVVEFFDGKTVRGLLLDEKYLAGFIARVEQLDPALGAVILDITSESRWRNRAQKQRSHWHTRFGIDRARCTRVDQALV